MRTATHLFLILILWSQCATIMTPTGGPKDKKPPTLITSIPKPKQLNYQSRTIELTFDETIKLNNPNEEIIISPAPGKDVAFRSKGNKVIITSPTPFADNTTYSILFREGIQDITESNSPSNLKLAFSTGPHIDSLAISGYVTELLSGTPRDKITVAIYSSDTFDIFNSMPMFFTKTNKLGQFKLDNIKAGRYKIYAFDDINKNLKVESRSEMYGFINQFLNLDKNVDTIRLGIIRLDSRPLKLSSIRNIGTITRLRFSKYLTNYSIKSEDEVTHAFADNQTEVNLWNPTSGDSLNIQLLATDSLENPIDTTFYIKKTQVRPLEEKFTWSLGVPSINSETARMVTTMKFNKPLHGINLDSLFIEIDTTSRIQFTKADFTYDQQFKLLTFGKDLDKKLFGANQDPQLKLMARPGFLTTVEDDTTKALSSRINIYWPEENGTITVQAITKSPYYILQLQDRQTRNIVGEAINTPKLTAKNIPPSEYQIRVIVDTNNNGKWDPGNIFKGIEPEKIIYYKTPEGTTSIPVRANWEIGPIQLSF